jgi:hypothetical protein
MWIDETGVPFNNGARIGAFMAGAKENAKLTMTPNEIIALDDVLAECRAIQTPPPLASRKLVKEWIAEDLQPHLDHVGKRRSLERVGMTNLKKLQRVPWR